VQRVLILRATLIQKLRDKMACKVFGQNVGFNNIYFSTARSMARFGLLNLNKGIWDTVPILNDTNYFTEMTTTSQDMNRSYGYLWWLNGKK
jgi:CubicO group peptidase (beta-lactamase class C family)